jgi:hypothetical protein
MEWRKNDQDRSSAITLAGAAHVILSQFLLNDGKENFSDQLMKQEAETTGVMPARGAHGRAVNDMLMINAFKHMDPGDDDQVEMDVLVIPWRPHPTQWTTTSLWPAMMRMMRISLRRSSCGPASTRRKA